MGRGAGVEGAGSGIEGTGYGAGSLEGLGRGIDFYRKFRELVAHNNTVLGL